MSCSPSDILTLAVKQIGVSEKPSGSNTVKYNTAYYGKKVTGSAYPWCCVFIWWLFDNCGASNLFFAGGKTASCTALMNFAKKNGLWVTSGFKPGDLILFNFDDDYTADHVGICESADTNSVTCIEGNTSITSDDNGGCVMRRTRSTSFVLGAYRPRYDENSNTSCNVTVTLPTLKNGSRGESVRALQSLLNGFGFNCGNVDGIIGKNTLAAIKRFQSDENIEIDGIVGIETWTRILS